MCSRDRIEPLAAKESAPRSHSQLVRYLCFVKAQHVHPRSTLSASSRDAQRFNVPATTRAGDAVQHFQTTEGAKREWMLESPNTNLQVFIRCKSSIKKKKTIIRTWQYGETTGIKRPFTKVYFHISLWLLSDSTEPEMIVEITSVEFYLCVLQWFKKACVRIWHAEDVRMGQVSWILLDQHSDTDFSVLLGNTHLTVFDIASPRLSPHILLIMQLHFPDISCWRTSSEVQQSSPDIQYKSCLAFKLKWTNYYLASTSVIALLSYPLWQISIYIVHCLYYW